MQKHRISGEVEENKDNFEGGSSTSFSKAYSCRLAVQTSDDLYDENARLRKELTRLRVLMTARHAKGTAEMDNLSMYFTDAQERVSLKPQDNKIHSGTVQKKKDPPPSDNTFEWQLPAITEFEDSSE